MSQTNWSEVDDSNFLELLYLKQMSIIDGVQTYFELKQYFEEERVGKQINSESDMI